MEAVKQAMVGEDKTSPVDFVIFGGWPRGRTFYILAIIYNALTIML